MKKKLLIALFIATLFVCVFAISVSAATTNEFGTVETLTGISEKSAFGTDGTANGYTSKVVLFDGTEYHTYPAYYIFSNSTSLSFSFDEIKTATGVEYDKLSVVRAEVPQNVVKTQKTFQSAKSLVSVHLPSSLTQISQDGFNGCSALVSVNIPVNCQSTGQYAFSGCGSLTSVVFEGTSFITLGDRTFEYCSNLESITLPEGLETISSRVFYGCNKLAECNLPSTLTTIKSQAFQSCKFATAVIPVGVTSLPSKAFDYCSLRTVTIPNTMTSIDSNAFAGSGVTTIIYTGVEGDEIYTKLKEIKPNATFTFVNHCETYYNSTHDIKSDSGNECCGICSRCGENEMLDVPKHNSEWIFNGGENVDYTAAITAEHVCKWCKTVDNTETIAIIVSTDGYSTEDNGTGVYQLTKVNKTALSRYAELSEQTFDYGIFAGIAAEDEGTPLTLDENGIATAVDTKNTVYASFTGTQYTYLQIKVTGLDKDASIYCGAYLIIGEDIIYLADKKIGTTVSKFVPTIVQ